MPSPLQRLRQEEAPQATTGPNVPRKFFLGSTDSTSHEPLRAPLITPLVLATANRPQSTPMVSR